MTMTKQELHKHKFKNPKLFRVEIQDRKQPMDYKGETMGLVLKYCDCGKDTAADYAKYTLLLEKYKSKSRKPE